MLRKFIERYKKGFFKNKVLVKKAEESKDIFDGMQICLDIFTGCFAKCRYCYHQYNNITQPQAISRENFYKILTILKREGFSFVYPYLSGNPYYILIIGSLLKHFQMKGSLQKLQQS